MNPLASDFVQLNITDTHGSLTIAPHDGPRFLLAVSTIESIGERPRDNSTVIRTKSGGVYPVNQPYDEVVDTLTHLLKGIAE
jgi:uncharacterized protein YlzI (FlbEa/FlbD family)